MTNPFRMDGQAILITGAGSGIGRATALSFASHGADVAVTEVPGRGHLAEAVVEQIRQQGCKGLALTLDVRASLTVEDAVDTVAAHFGRLDVLVNNAGTQLFKPALEVSEGEWDEVLSVNLKGPFLCAQAAGRIMMAQGGGCIVNVASQHGVVGNVKRAPYCASKGGLLSLTRQLAIEWAPYGIRVNAVSPTFVYTESNSALLSSAPDLAEEIRTGIPLGRPATPEDVASAILYLAAPAARMVTGHNLMVDGGWTAR